MDPESVKALKKAALQNCYVKEYSDVFEDDVVYFPLISSKVLDYSLIEEAEEFYYNEEDGFQQWETVAIQKVVATAVAKSEAEMEEDEVVNNDYMTKLALDVELE